MGLHQTLWPHFLLLSPSLMLGLHHLVWDDLKSPYFPDLSHLWVLYVLSAIPGMPTIQPPNPPVTPLTWWDPRETAPCLWDVSAPQASTDLVCVPEAAPIMLYLHYLLFVHLIFQTSCSSRSKTSALYVFSAHRRHSTNVWWINVCMWACGWEHV